MLNIWPNALLNTPSPIQLLQNDIVSSILVFLQQKCIHTSISKAAHSHIHTKHKHSYTKMYIFCRVFYQYINTSIHCMFTVEPLITFLTSSYSRGKEKTSSVTFYNISLHEKWILVRTPGNLIGLLLLLLQLYFLLTSRLFRSSL